MIACAPCADLHARGLSIAAYWKGSAADCDSLAACSRVEKHARDLLARGLRPTLGDVPYDLAHIHYTNMGQPSLDDAGDECGENWIGARDADLQVWTPRWFWLVQRTVLPNIPLTASDLPILPRSKHHRPDVLALPVPIANRIRYERDFTRWWRAVLGEMDDDHREAVCSAYDLGGERAVRELLFSIARRPEVLRAIEAAP